jgi:Tfp pilus assembly protein PilV
MERIERGPRAGEAGFTIVEGLIAALILAIVLIGVLPMVTRSMQNNLQGNDATNEANAVTDELESLYSLPFNNPELNVLAGQFSLASTDYYLNSTNTWSTTIPTPKDDQYTRNVTVEYFGGADLQADGTLDTPLDGGSLSGAIQLKRVTLEVTKRRVLGANPYRVLTIKAY